MPCWSCFSLLITIQLVVPTTQLIQLVAQDACIGFLFTLGSPSSQTAIQCASYLSYMLPITSFRDKGERAL